MLVLCCDQIRVNSVNPTVVMTDMGRLGWSEPEKAQTMTSRIPLGRFAGETQEAVVGPKLTYFCAGCRLLRAARVRRQSVQHWTGHQSASHFQEQLYILGNQSSISELMMRIG